MTRPLALALSAGALSASSFASAAEVQLAASGPVIELDVYEAVQVEPDMATVSAGVTTDAASATEALRANSAQMLRVVDRIKALGIAAKDIQTTGISLSPRYDYSNASPRPAFMGYQAMNRVTVNLREIERTGAVLDALVAAGATDLGGPVFSVEDDSAARDAARERAMQRARERALAYAAMAGFSNVRLLAVGETLTQVGPMPKLEMRNVAADAVAAAPPVQSGMVSTGVSVSVKFEMASPRS
ncbi:MAG TPA: SIMPL domain-containing protein [Erythrobacter sp.]|nr:SIMPL domain-containing protein [Erythrobacter sp.]